MSFLTERRPASFRGVPFLVEGHTTSFGRKTAVYDLPFESNGAAHLDMGRRPRKYKLRAMLLETNDNSLKDQRDALVEAFETPGAGLLVHPIYGEKNVVILGDVNFLESTQSGGLIEIECEFMEARTNPPAIPKLDPKSNLVNKAKALRKAAGDNFASTFNTRVPDFVAASNIATLDHVLDDIKHVNNLVSAALAVPTHFAHQLTLITEQATQLLGTPQLLYNALDSLVAELHQDVVQLAKAAFTSKGGLITPDAAIVASAGFGLTADTPAGTTPDRIIERENHARLLVAVRASALGSAAQAIADLEFTSANDARNASDTLTSQLDQLATEPVADVEIDPPVFEAVRDLIAAVTARLSAVAGTLTELTTYTPATTLPAAVVAWNLYSDASRDDEILGRNPSIVHPLFVPGREPLEVLAP